MSRYSIYERWSLFNYEIGAGNLHTALLIPFRGLYCERTIERWVHYSRVQVCNLVQNVLILRPLLYRHILYLMHRGRVPHKSIIPTNKRNISSQLTRDVIPRAPCPIKFYDLNQWPRVKWKIRKEKRIKLNWEINMSVRFARTKVPTIWKHKFIRMKILVMQYTYAVKSYFSFEFLHSSKPILWNDEDAFSVYYKQIQTLFFRSKT